jgi:pimeloyl-ACP methyl ester carboxylesterase
MGGAAAAWNALGDALDAQKYRLVALDFRGHGQSHREPCSFTIDRLARDVTQLVDELKVERFAVAGHSFGGKVALRVAALVPRRVTGLALIGSVGPGLVPLERPMMEGILRRAAELDFIREVFRPWFGVWPQTEIDEAIATFTQTPVWALRAVCEAALWTDITADVPVIGVAALVIVGADDPVYGPAYQAQAVRPFVPHAVMVTIAGCGHGLILERPADIARHLDPFLGLLR